MGVGAVIESCIQTALKYKWDLVLLLSLVYKLPSNISGCWCLLLLSLVYKLVSNISGVGTVDAVIESCT